MSAAPAPARRYLGNYLLGVPFGWDELASMDAVEEIVGRWLEFFFFKEPVPLDRDNLDRCEFNGTSRFSVTNVAHLFVIDALAAGFDVDERRVRATIAGRLRPLVEARLEREHGRLAAVP